MKTLKILSKKRARFLLLIIGIVLGASACARHVKPSFFPADGQTAACAGFLLDLDKAVAEAGVNNAAVFRVDGFPYLRANRFLCGLKNRLSAPEEEDMWVDWMLAEDMIARYAEISCLPPDVRERLAVRADVEPSAISLATHAGACAAALLADHRTKAGFYESLAGAVKCPEEYNTAMRVAGLYPLASLPIEFLTKKAHRRMTAWLRQPPEDRRPEGEVIGYLPESRSTLATERLAGIIRGISGNPLSTPIPDMAARQALVENFAPVIMQDVTDDIDRFGILGWQDDELTVDGDRPAVYYYFTNAFYRDRPILQINYAFWYPARKGPGAPTLEWGPLDGLTVRVSLGSDGRPVMVDIMNNCGCYHFFIPAQGSIKTVKPQPWTIDAFAPVELPASFPQDRLNVHVIADWHQVSAVTAGPPPANGLTYRLVPYETLEMLPRTGDSHESAFNEKGIAKGSDRIEPFILFSAGIPKVGSMRQRSHHALKLVGRSYFSDPYLFDQNFEFTE